MKAFKSFLLLLYCLASTGAQAQAKFKVGDWVEVFSAGDATHGVIVGAYQDSGYGYGTYQVHLDGEKYCNNHVLDTRVNAEFIKKRFRTDAVESITVGHTAEVRRYDGTVYTGQVLGKDGEKYQVRYSRDGMEVSDWFHLNNIRNATPPQAITANKTTKETTTSPATNNKTTTSASWPGQKFKVGDRVMYDDLGFLVTKSFGRIIAVDPKKRLYTIQDENDPSTRYSYTCYQVVDPNQKINNDFFIGKWEVHINGATSTFSQNGKSYRRFSGSMQLPPLEIKANGTYTWVTTNNKVINGTWKHRKGVPGIVLLKALNGLDYTLYEKTEGFATTKNTRDEIGLHHLPSSTGYYHAYRIGENKSGVLTKRVF